MPSTLPKKTMLCSSDDVTKMAELRELSTRASLAKQVIASDDTVTKNSDKHYSKIPNVLPPPNNELIECKQHFIAAYPGKIGLRWNPCVGVSSGEDIPMQLGKETPTNKCNCRECTSMQCPATAKRSKSVFKDNIMRFRDNTTMTPKLNHAGCGPQTPIASPKSSFVSLAASQTQTRFDIGYYTQPPQPPLPPRNQFYRKPFLRNDFPDPWYDEAVSRDTCLNDQEECSILKRPYNRPCVSTHPDLHYESGKVNVYNEGISQEVAEKYPISPSPCPHRVRFGSRSFCGNSCPDCGCIPPFTPDVSKYHQQCTRPVYERPVHYDYEMDPDEMQHFVAIPRIVTDRYGMPIRPPKRGPSIILPKKVLTSERDINTFIKDLKPKKNPEKRNFFRRPKR